MALDSHRLKLPSTSTCLLYTSDAADDSLRVDLGGRRIIKKAKTRTHCAREQLESPPREDFFFKQKTAYEIHERLVGSEMCIRDSLQARNEFAETFGPNNLKWRWIPTD